MKKVTETVAELARPVVEEHGCTLWTWSMSARQGSGTCAF